MGNRGGRCQSASQSASASLRMSADERDWDDQGMDTGQAHMIWLDCGDVRYVGTDPKWFGAGNGEVPGQYEAHVAFSETRDNADKMRDIA